MASPELHIKDSYAFEVPKFLWPSNRYKREDFPDWWVKLDPDYQLWEAEHLHHAAVEVFGDDVPAWEDLEHEYTEWKHHDHKNFGKPFDAFLMSTQDWFSSKLTVSNTTADGEAKSIQEVEADQKAVKEWKIKWEGARNKHVEFADFKQTWAPEKIEGYNTALDGKILIPQPFGELKNLHEPASGFVISRFMVIEVVVGLILVWVFALLAKRVQSGDPPKGKLWNMLEAVLLFLRDEVARPAIGKKEADKFVPLLWTIFLFILGCNLMGMLPWAGAPTGAFGVTLAMACVTFGTVWLFGSKKFGFVGFWLNQAPTMDLPWYMAILIKPMILVIEIVGLFIKHGVLAVRLLANMVAGHLVLMAIMMLAFSVAGAMSPSWPLTAVIAIVASTLFSLLELFVAFLQAYVFTFLSALFIGAAIHHH